MNLANRILNYGMAVLKEAWGASLPLIKITIPVVIVVRLFDLIGLNMYVNAGLGPFMEFAGLPKDAGVVWASALVGNLYSAFMVFLNRAGELQLTVAQVTTLLSMVVIAHSLPMELRVTQLVGINPIYMGLLRFFGAVGLGWALYHLYQATGAYQQPAQHLASTVAVASKGWGGWMIGEIKNLALIYFIVLGLLLLTHLMRLLRIDVLLQLMLWPLNALLKTDRKTTNFNVIAMIAGISYGSALMWQELKKHHFTRRDILLTMTFMGLAHGLSEETLLMIALGADWTGVLLSRVLLGCLAALAVSIVIKGRPEVLSNRWVLDGHRLDMAGIKG